MTAHISTKPMAPAPAAPTALPSSSSSALPTEAHVSLATPDDIPSLISMFWEAFSGPAEVTFPHTDGGRLWLERSFQNFLGKPSSPHYNRPVPHVPVIRNLNGRPIAFAIAHVVKPGQLIVGSSWKRRWGDVGGIKDVDGDRLAGYFEPLARAHHLAVGREGHVYIELLVTKRTARNRGYATALVNWLANLADDLGYACYLDGGGRGMVMLEHAGFVAKDIGYRYSDAPPPCVPMIRPGKQK
ncbi:hypothetical protein F4777DRAFT_579098 [Nemania sp. FL0916]|nr:hypothetical protein F4777DRAFT_579098 [Nemania sp. FL0916]